MPEGNDTAMAKKANGRKPSRFHPSARLRLYSRSALAFLAGGSLLALLFGEAHAQVGSGKLFYTEWLAYLLVLLPLYLFLRKIQRFLPAKVSGLAEAGMVPPLILLVFMVLFLFSGSVRHPGFYFAGWLPSPADGQSVLASGIFQFVLLTAILMPLMIFHVRRMWLILLLVLLGAQAGSAFYFLKATGGAPLWGNEHSFLMFRLWEVGQTFPQMVNYDPFWNGGTVACPGITSGVGALGLPLLPLWKWTVPASVYTVSLGLIFIVVIPWLTAWTLRITGSDWTIAFGAGILALGVGQPMFRWVLNDGAAGVALASFFVLPMSACVFRVIWLGKTERWLAVVLVTAAFLLLQWLAGIVAAASVAVSLVACIRRGSFRKMVFLFVCGVVVALLCFCPFMIQLLKGDSPQALVTGAMEMTRRHGFLVQGLKQLGANLLGGNPILLFLGLGGVFVISQKSVRQWWRPLVVMLALVAGWGAVAGPELRLGRMAMPLLFAAIAPASMLVARILTTHQPILAFAKGALLALLILGGVNACRWYGGAGPVPYRLLPTEVTSLTEWIRARTPEDGRILFAGRTDRAYGQGCVAYWPVFAGREMMALDYGPGFAARGETDYPPAVFRQTEERLFEFLNAYNVTHIVTGHDGWKERLRRQPGLYDEAVTQGDKTVFRVVRKPSWFVRNGGSVSAGFNRIRVRLEDPTTEAVIRYNWSADLSATPPVQLFPQDAGHGIVLIGIRPHGKRDFTIEYRSQ